MKSKKSRLKKLPALKSDKEAEKFVETADLSEYDLSGMVRMRFEFLPKTERVNLRLPENLLNAVRERAASAGMPYQRYIRLLLEQALGRPPEQKSKARANVASK
jgi:predicted DNA binding CopG/RHH family protein